MSVVLAGVSWILILTGSFFVVAGAVGLLRLPDVYSRIHAGGVTDTLGAGLILLGLLFQSPDWMVAVKLIMIMGFLFFTSPTSTHALVRAAFTTGVRPALRDQDVEDRLFEGEAVSDTRKDGEASP